MICFSFSMLFNVILIVHMLFGRSMSAPIAVPVGVLWSGSSDEASSPATSTSIETKDELSSSSSITKLPTAYAVRTISGQGGEEGNFKDGKASDAAFSEPQGIVTDDIGNVYVSDWVRHFIPNPFSFFPPPPLPILLIVTNSLE
jgi:hypothetical protein